MRCIADTIGVWVEVRVRVRMRFRCEHRENVSVITRIGRKA